jgi:PST family polysaccharide transporter
LASAVAWTAAGKWAAQLFASASTLIVVRWLSPNDFGLIGLATTYLGFILVLSEFGIGSAIITLRNLTRSQIAQLNTTAILLGLMGTMLSVLIAVPISRFFRTQQLAAIVAVMGLNFVISAFRTVPCALMQRDLRFRTLSWIDVAQSLIQALVSVFLVWKGIGYWALVIGALAGSAVAAFLPLAWCRAPFSKPVFRSIRESIVFSWQILASRLSWYLYSNSDFVVAGRVLGTAPLGAYTIAWNFANLPGEKIVTLVTGVVPTFLAAAQYDKTALRRYFASLTEVLALIMFPITIGFALLAPELVPLALGPHWQAAIIPMQLLALYMFLRSVVALLPQVLNVAGETRFCMRVSLAILGILPVSFFVASRWGIIAIASIWISIYPLLALPLYGRTLRTVGMPAGEYLALLKPPLISTIVMSAFVFAAMQLLPHGMPAALKLACEVLTGAVAYMSALFLLFRSQTLTYIQFIRAFRNRPAVATQ